MVLNRLICNLSFSTFLVCEWMLAVWKSLPSINLAHGEAVYYLASAALQLAEQSLPTPENRRSNPVIGKTSFHRLSNVFQFRKDKNNQKRGREWPVFFKNIVYSSFLLRPLIRWKLTQRKSHRAKPWHQRKRTTTESFRECWSDHYLALLSRSFGS